MRAYLSVSIRVLLVLPVLSVALAARVDATTIYRWQDAAGRPYYSNLAAKAPPHATEADLPPLGLSQAARSVPGTIEEAARRRDVPARPVSRIEVCPPADASGIAAAVAGRLADRERPDELTLFVDDVPIAYPSGANLVQVAYGADRYEESAALEQGAIAYPAGTPCPERPPLARYAVASGARTRPRTLCDDYRRAFAEVGVTVSRDHGVARSFRGIAEDFATIAARGYEATESGTGILIQVAGDASVPAAASLEPPSPFAPGYGVALPPWLVEAHVAQTAELAREAEALADELAVALEEIDRAARAVGCW